QSLTVSTPSGLLGVPVESGGNYTDTRGQQLVCDVIDLNANKRIANNTIVKVNDYSITKSSNKSGDTYFIKIKGKNTIPGGNNEERKSGALCNYFNPGTAFSNLIGFDFTNINLNTGEQNIRFCFGPVGSMPTLEDAEAWFASHEVFVIYPLANPITTPLSAEELTAYRTLHTYDGATVVSTAEDVAGVEVRYVADSEKYIDRKISEAITSAAATQLASYDALSGSIREGVNGV